ncbi:hypothetical protein BDV93DRAFT_524549 [Ceratobasidium sp. AG-I]|nr:hypothetical protein BDV93DRAFT_524549 [Ceratobasidium sp. AG-I]
MRALLSSAVQSYVDACDSLRNGFNYSTISSQPRIVERALLDIESELASLELEEYRLRNARTTLHAVRNQSTILAPINVLPPELLVRIFGYLDPSTIMIPSGKRPTRGLFHYPETLLGVCSGWHQLVTSTPVLWPYIDIEVDSFMYHEVYRHARIRCKYAKDTPLQIRISAPTYAPLYSEAIPMLEQFMTQHADQISMLELNTHSFIEPVLNSVLLSWVKYASPTIARGFSISNMTSVQYDIWDLVQRESSNLDRESNLARLSLLLERIQVLHIDGVFFDWRGPAFRGLVDLRLVFMDNQFSPTASDIVAILSSSPALRHLVLDEIGIQSHNDTMVVPIHLEHLETLDVAGLSPGDVELMLTLISPGAVHLSLFLPLIRNPRPLTVIRNFFSRSHITTLRILADLGYDWEHLLDGSQSWLQFEYLPYLRHLGLFHAISEAEEDSKGKFPPPEFSGIYPKLSTLSLHCCVLKTESLRSIIDLCSVKALRVAACIRADRPPELHSRPEDETKGLLEWISTIVPDAQGFRYHGRRLIA